MPISVPCPQCGKVLRAPDDLGGRKVQCPSCRATFVVPQGGEPVMPAVRRLPAAPPPPPSSDPFAFDEPGLPGEGGYAPRELPSGWGTVRVGLALMSWGVLLY